MEKIKRINENEIEVDNSVYRKVEEPKPEFKVGDWVHTDSDGSIFRITEIGGTGLYSGVGNGGFCNWEYTRLRHATKDEIGSHLKKICDEKYVGKMVRCLLDRNYNEPDLQVQKVKYFDEYKPISDELRYSDGFHWICVYKQGKWAEIISNKKKLPETKEELRNLMQAYVDSTKYIDNFLKDYE